VRYVSRDNGADVVVDDMPPSTRAVALLLEHANRRRAEGLSLPCACDECRRHRGAVRCWILADGTLAVESA
jgi:hypothetical protein